MKPSTIVITLAALFAGVFLGASGALVVSHERALGSRFAYVEVLNHSGMTARDIELVYADGTLRHGPLPGGETVLLPVPCRGEGSYSIRVRLDDGRDMSGEERLVEAGVRVQERIGDDGITHQPLGAY